jgi:predicted oxidoreductase (fatty acid repression mutant protein)
MVSAERAEAHSMPEGIRLLRSPGESATADLRTLLDRRRSIRRLVDGPFDAEVIDKLTDAIRYTPSAYNTPPWHVVIVREERTAFWDVIEGCFRNGLSGERLERYLKRLDGFRDGVGAILVFENLDALPELQQAWNLHASQALAFVQQGIGMVQLSIWLALTEVGLVTSLQHWEWLAESHIAQFTGVPAERFKLAAVMPIGYAAEPPRVVERPAAHQVVSFDRFAALNGAGA